MKNLDILYEKALHIVCDLGIVPGDIVSVKTNNRFTRKWGQCSTDFSVPWEQREFTIEIAGILLQDDVDEIVIIDTILHEILHTCKGCFNHGKQWKKYAKMIHQAYPEYHITRASSFDEKSVETKYIIVCNDCKRKSYVMRKPNGYKDHKMKRYRCALCGGKLKLYYNQHGKKGNQVPKG